MAAVADLDNGAIILPGLDIGLDDPSWDAIAAGDDKAIGHPEHPQYGFVKLLRALGTDSPINEILRALPDAPSTYYIHDVAMLPEARGARAGSAAVRAIVDHATASGMSNVALVAIKGSEGFWSRHGFETVSDPQLDKKLKSYDEAARYMVRRL